jgi:DNA polymerase-1
MIALIDADLLCFRVGFTTQDVVEGIARARIEESIQKILETLQTDKYQCILSPSDGSNFRYTIDPSYKANRKDAPKPVHLPALREYLLEAHNATVAHGEEADDLLGITQMKTLGDDSTVIVSIDKDLNQIPGNHHNFVKGETYYVSPVEGLRWFYKQMLIGDTSDNVPGVSGIGPVKAGKLLDPLSDEAGFYSAVRQLYEKQFGERANEVLRRNGILLKIRTRPGEIWEPPC